MLATVHEITEKIVGERRIMALRDLGTKATNAKTAEEGCAIAAEARSSRPAISFNKLRSSRAVAESKGGAEFGDPFSSSTKTSTLLSPIPK